MYKALLCAALLSGVGCTAPAPPADRPAALPAGSVISLGAIETDSTGRCFARAAGPTQTTVITEMIEVVPEVRDPSGTVLSPAIFRNVTRPQTVSTGLGPRFETLCPQLLTQERVATLQRALIVRRSFSGPVSGNYDEATSLAVQQFQRGAGIDSPLLAVSVARDLGLVAVPRS